MSSLGGKGFSMQYIAVMLIVLSFVAATSSFTPEEAIPVATVLEREQPLNKLQVVSLFNGEDALIEEELEANTFLLRNHDLILQVSLYLDGEDSSFYDHFPRVQAVRNYLLKHGVDEQYFRIVASSESQEYQASFDYFWEKIDE